MAGKPFALPGTRAFTCLPERGAIQPSRRHAAGAGLGVLLAQTGELMALGGHAGLPFLALLAQGFPRLTTITQELLIPTSDEHPHAPGVRAEVLVRDDRAVIPDLDAIEAMVAKALAA